MKKFYAILIIFVCFTFTACKKSVFVPDPDNGLLPAYSETGTNIAGALLNDTAWRCQQHPCFTCVLWRFFVSSSISGDSTVFVFAGKYTPTSVQYVDSYYRNVSTYFYFVVKGLRIENQDSLMKLNNKTFRLDLANGYCGISFDPFRMDNRGRGTLEIDKVQKKSWEFGSGTPDNPKAYGFNLSGHFNFTTTLDRDYKVTDGRFDMHVNQDSNFDISD